MRVGIISYYEYDEYIKPKKKLKIYENWHKAWEEVFNLSIENNIQLNKYQSKEHVSYDKLIFLEIPRINELIKILLLNIFKKRIFTILIINETFLGRPRYLLKIPFLFNKVLINCEDKIDNFMSYKVETFSYPSLPKKQSILKQKSLILNPNRKNKLVFIGSFKIALSQHGSYLYRYKLVKELLKYPNYFELYGYGWNKTPLPFNIVGIAIILRFNWLKKLVKSFMKSSFKPLGEFPIADSKYKTLSNYEFSLAIEPTISKFNSICEKIFDPMLSGSIPIYFGQKFNHIPENTYIRINKKNTAKDIAYIIENLSEDKKKEYRKNIFNFLNSKEANRYRYSYYAKKLINAILY